MPLLDITHGPKFVDSKKIEKMECVQVLYNPKKMHSATLERIIKTVDEAIESTVKDVGSRLIWTKAGALFGHKSSRPKKDVDHLWDKIVKAVGDGKECLWSVGALLMWRISQRNEKWVVLKQDTDGIDPDTGKVITVAEYWIVADYGKYESKKPKTNTLEDLVDKFKPK